MKNLLVVLMISLLMGSCNSFNEKISPKTNENTKKENINIDTAAISLKSIDDLHERLTLKSYDISLTKYINSKPNVVDSIRKVVYILPFGNMKPKVEKIIRSEVEYLKAFFQLEVKVLDRIPYDSIKKLMSIETRLVSSSDFEFYSNLKGGTPALTEQIQASSFIGTVLKNIKPKDAVALLGITEHDIYNPKFNYLYGLSELKGGVGLVSTFRLIDYGSETKNNIRKVISKQIVNMFSISNVKDYKCVINYHNDINELYQGIFDISPRALEKLKYAIGFDYKKRFYDLSKFWERENKMKEVKYYQECYRRM